MQNVYDDVAQFGKMYVLTLKLLKEALHMKNNVLVMRGGATQPV